MSHNKEQKTLSQSMVKFAIAFLFFISSTVFADPIKMYEIYNASRFEFINKSGDTKFQCQKFNAIPAQQKISKVIDFDGAQEIQCIAVVKEHETCGLNLTLIPRSLLKVSPFGDCGIQAVAQKKTQVIDKLIIS